jgi:hypothetical protein
MKYKNIKKILFYFILLILLNILFCFSVVCCVGANKTMEKENREISLTCQNIFVNLMITKKKLSLYWKMKTPFVGVQRRKKIPILLLVVMMPRVLILYLQMVFDWVLVIKSRY